MNLTRPNYTIGMSEKEFTQLNRNADRAFADARGITIYRTANGLQSPVAFFIFQNGVLKRYQEGQNLDDYKFMVL